MANGECESFHVREHSNMLILSLNRCMRRRFAVCVCIRSWGVSSRAAARVRFDCFDRSCFLSETCCCLLFPTEYKAGGAMVSGDGVSCEDGVGDFV